MFEYLRLIKFDWFTDGEQGWHGHTPLTVIAVVALVAVALIAIVARHEGLRLCRDGKEDGRRRGAEVLVAEVEQAEVGVGRACGEAVS